MKFLNGKELAGYIKERQARDVRRLRQTSGITPKLAIVVTVDNPVIEVYMRLKHRYGADIGAPVDIHRVSLTEVDSLLSKLSEDPAIHGIIVQLPLSDPAQTDRVVNLIAPEKDVDGLSSQTTFEPATALAIIWLLAGYNIDMRGKDVLLVGHGKLVGKPLEKLLLASDITPRIADRNTLDLRQATLSADVIVTATGQPGLLKSDMIKPGAVVVDAGVASEGGKTVGDVAAAVYEERDDLTITPTKGGVGPLTVCALFENVIQSARRMAQVPSAPEQTADRYSPASDVN